MGRPFDCLVVREVNQQEADKRKELVNRANCIARYAPTEVSPPLAYDIIAFIFNIINQ